MKLRINGEERSFGELASLDIAAESRE